MEDTTRNNLTESEIRLERADKGGTHKSSRFNGSDDGCIIRLYALNGVFTAEFGTINEAILWGENNNKKFTYSGIYQALTGRQKSYGGFFWRSNRGEGSGLKEM